jgi:hypothetical protein
MDMRGSEDGSSIELVKVDGKGKRRFWGVRRDGATIEARTWTEGKAPKPTSKVQADEAAAMRAFDKAVRSKLRDGYVFVRDPRGVESGAIVFAAFASGGGGGPVLDLSFDGTLAVTAGMRGAPTDIWLETVDTRTGARERVYAKTAERQVFLHTACFDHAGESIVLLVNEQTLHLDLRSGKTRTIADCSGPNFNPFVVQPHFDRARERLVVFDKGTIVRVLGKEGQPLLDVPLEHKTTECRAARISPSGKLLALYRVSRGIVYGHDDAKGDTTNVVDVWDVDQGKLRTTLEMPTKIDRVGLDPRDEVLVVSLQYCEGPVLYDLATGKARFRFAASAGNDRLPTVHAWDWSPDGARLAVGRETLVVYAYTEGMREVEVERSSEYRVKKVVHSGDGVLLATFEDGTVVVRAMGPGLP